MMSALGRKPNKDLHVKTWTVAIAISGIGLCEPSTVYGLGDILPLQGIGHMDANVTSNFPTHGASAFILPGKMPQEVSDCRTLDEEGKFLAYVACRNKLKEARSTSIQIIEERHGTGTDSFSRRRLVITTESELAPGRWTLPAPRFRLLYSNCERSWPDRCFLTSQGTGTLEMHQTSDGRAEVVVNVVFTPDQSYSPGSEPEVMAISVEAERTTPNQ